MKDQHKKISTYRDLSQDEINLMNECKSLEAKFNDLHERIMGKAKADNHGEACRYAAIAKTDVEGGFMWLVKSVARPTKPALEDAQEVEETLP